MRSDVTPLEPDEWLDRTLELFVESALLSLPVADGSAERRAVGIVKRVDVSKAYLRYVFGPNSASS